MLVVRCTGPDGGNITEAHYLPIDVDHDAPVPVHWDSHHHPYVESTPKLNANAMAIVFDGGLPR